MLFPRKKRRCLGFACKNIFRFPPTSGWKFDILYYKQFKTLRSTHRLAIGETWKFYCESHYGVEDAPVGRFFFRGFSQGFPGPHRKHGRGLRPLSLPRNQQGARKEEAAYGNGKSGVPRRKGHRLR